MTQLPPHDKRWQEFLRQYRPTPPPAASELEEQLMNAIETTPQRSAISWRLLAVPSALAKHRVSLFAAGLVMALSSYRILIPSQEPSNYVSLEAFLESNWNEVTTETPTSSQINTVPADWTLEASAAQ
jgi:hypothetical protein